MNKVPKLGASGLILQNNNICLIRREKAPYKNRWTLPGGNVNEGETINQAIIREIREETGLVVQCNDQKALMQSIQKYNFLLFTKVCSIVEAQQQLEDIKWQMMSISDFQALRPRQCTPNLHQIVDYLLQ